jgi:uncharacterized membrane protein
MADTTHVHHTGNGGNGRGGLYVLMGIIIALIIVALVLFLPRGTGDDTRDIDADIRIETPEMPAAPGDGNTGGGGTGGGTPEG